MTDKKTISHYQILGEAGRGGMATVFLAQDMRIDRRVVIKVLPSYFVHDPNFRGRFYQEAKVVVKLSHPHIVPVYEYGEEEDGPYLVMGYMSGGTLREQIMRGPMAVDETISILTPIASALDYAHSKGIVHRDLKPANILFNESGAAYLADFGIVKLNEATQSFTGSAIIGTPAYMSPEQVQGGIPIDGRSDIYSLGVILYEMLIGDVPYKGNTPTQQLMKHVLEPVPAIRQKRPDISMGVEAVLMKAMAKDPADRYPNATAFVNALRSPQDTLMAQTIVEDAGGMAAAYSGSAAARAETVVDSSPTGPMIRTIARPDAGYAPAPVKAAERRGPPWLLIAGIAVILLLCIGGGVTAYLLMGRGTAPAPEPAAAEVAAPLPGEDPGAAQQTTAAAAQQTAEAAAEQTRMAASEEQQADSDHDGLTNGDEERLGTNPASADTDNDGLDDSSEVNGPTDPLNPDSDGDGLSDGDEQNRYRSNPLNPDSDLDGLNDGDEINRLGTDPNNRDTDGDTLPDGNDPDPGRPPTSTVPPPPTDMPTAVPTRVPTDVPTRMPESVYCPGAFPTRLAVGDRARIVNSQVNVRSGPGTSYSVNNQLMPGREVAVLAGPECDDGQLWYYVRSDTFTNSAGESVQAEGWVVEESGSQWFMEPAN